MVIYRSDGAYCREYREIENRMSERELTGEMQFSTVSISFHETETNGEMQTHIVAAKTHSISAHIAKNPSALSVTALRLFPACFQFPTSSLLSFLSISLCIYNKSYEIAFNVYLNKRILRLGTSQHTYIHK